MTSDVMLRLSNEYIKELCYKNTKILLDDLKEKDDKITIDTSCLFEIYKNMNFSYIMFFILSGSKSNKHLISLNLDNLFDIVLNDSYNNMSLINNELYSSFSVNIERLDTIYNLLDIFTKLKDSFIKDIIINSLIMTLDNIIFKLMLYVDDLNSYLFISFINNDLSVQFNVTSKSL